MGKAIARKLLEEDFNVSTFSRNGKRCEDLGKEMESESLMVSSADVTKEEDMKRVVSSTLDKFGSIDILVNNAGFGYFDDVDAVDLKRYKEMMDTNVFGLALLTKLVVPHMKKRGSGLIMNIASIAGKAAGIRGEFYSSTKFAVMGYSDGIRKELKPHGIKVCTICPGITRTNFFDEKTFEERTKIFNVDPERTLLPEDIARAVSFVCGQPERCDIQDITIVHF